MNAIPKEKVNEIDQYLKELNEKNKKIMDAAYEATEVGGTKNFSKVFQKKLKKIK